MMGSFDYTSRALTRIEEFYGNRTAARSQVPLINHIHEGIKIMERRGVVNRIIAAYCLHPLFQDDSSLLLNHAELVKLDPITIVLILEYRRAANAYLLEHYMQGSSRPIRSPLAAVNEMLIADKVQNYKDFVRWHKATHPYAFELERYFIHWLEALHIAPDEYYLLIEGI